MLKKYLAFIKLKMDREELLDIITWETSGPAFPWCCEVYAHNDAQEQYVNLSYGIERSEIFCNPALAFVKFFRTVLQEQKNWKDLVPLFALVMSGSGDLIGQKEQTKVKLGILGLNPEEEDIEDMPDLAAMLRGSILSEDGKTFASRAFCDAFGFALFETGSMELLLNACDVEFFVRYVQVDLKQTNNVLIINATSKHYHNLLARVCYDLLNGNIVQMSQHRALQSDSFLADFDEFLRKNNCLKLLLSTRDPRHGMPLLYWSAWSDSGALTRWCVTRGVSVEDGQQLRQAFFVPCLFGEKVDSPRLADMFDMLCQDETVLEDVVSDVILPVPSAADVVFEELRAKRCQVLSGKALLCCGLSAQRDAEENASGTSPTSRPEDNIGPAPGPKQSNTLSTEGASGIDVAGSLDLTQHVDPAPSPSQSDTSPTADTSGMNTTSRLSEISSSLSGMSFNSGSSGSYITPIAIVNPYVSIYSTLSEISDNDSEIAVDDCRLESFTSTELPETATSNALSQKNRSTLANVPMGVSTQGRALLAEPKECRRTARPIPAGIVKIIVGEDQDKVVLQPK